MGGNACPVFDDVRDDFRDVISDESWCDEFSEFWGEDFFEFDFWELAGGDFRGVRRGSADAAGCSASSSSADSS